MGPTLKRKCLTFRTVIGQGRRKHCLAAIDAHALMTSFIGSQLPAIWCCGQPCFQRWICAAISVRGERKDIHLDGKLNAVASLEFTDGLWYYLCIYYPQVLSVHKISVMIQRQTSQNLMLK